MPKTIVRAARRPNPARRDHALESIWNFAHTYFRAKMTSPCGQFHSDLCADIDKALEPKGRLAGQCPREHAKTAFGTTFTSIYAVCKRLKNYILIISSSKEDTGQKRLQEVINEIETNELLWDDFGDILAPRPDVRGYVSWKDQCIVLNSGAQIDAMGFRDIGIRGRKSIIGSKRPDLIILDDPENDTHVESEISRSKSIKWLAGGMINGLDKDKGSIIWLGTILHEDSALARYIKNGSYGKGQRDRQPNGWTTFFLTAAMPDLVPGCTLLWPEHWTYDDLVRRKMEIGTEEFYREYMGQPVDPTRQTFRRDMWKWYDPNDIEIDHSGVWLYTRSGKRKLDVRAAVDPAATEGFQSDYTSIMVGGRDHTTGFIYMLEITRFKVHISALAEKVREVCARWHPRPLVFEAQVFQAAISYQLWQTGIPIQEIKHGVGDNKKRRISMSAMHPESGRIWLPSGNEAAKAFVDEAARWPKIRKDDQLDSFAMLMNEFERQGAPSSLHLSGNKRRFGNNGASYLRLAG